MNDCRLDAVSPPKRLLIVGAGAVGGTTGPDARIGLSVVVVARGEHGRAIQRDGLSFRSAAYPSAPACRVESFDQIEVKPGDVVATKLNDAEPVLGAVHAHAARSRSCVPPTACTVNVGAARYFDTVVSTLVDAGST